MARNKTQNLPDLSALLTPKNSLMLAVERAVLRGQDWAYASVPIAEQIAARLAGVITLDLVKSGQRLLESDISEVLHVSRAPVREAMRILERDRLVEFQARRGAIVTAPDENELRDIFRVRSVLYVTMLEQVARESPCELEALLTAHMPRLTKAAEESVDAYAVESFLLNFNTVDLCRNRVLVDVLHSISLRTLRYVRLGFVAKPQSVRASLKSGTRCRRPRSSGTTSYCFPLQPRAWTTPEMLRFARSLRNRQRVGVHAPQRRRSPK